MFVHAGIRHLEVEKRSQQVKQADNAQGHLGNGVDAGVDKGQVKAQQGLGEGRLDEQATYQCAQDDGANREALDPAIGHHQQAMGQVFGEDAVFGRRVGRRPQPDDGVGGKGAPEKHQRTTPDLDGVADQHDPPLGHGVGKRPDKGRQQHIRQGEEQLQQRFVFL